MIEFDNIDNIKSSQTEFSIVVPQRYIYSETHDLRSEGTNDFAQKFESQITSTTLPILPNIEIEKLNETRYQLIGKRNELLNSWFLFFRPNKRKQLHLIDKQLDDIEYQIISIQKFERESEAEYIAKFISENERQIQKYNSEKNTL